MANNIGISGILEKMTGKDKDFRYMATSDLLNELSKDGFKADHDLELKISMTVLQQLDDQSGDVSGLAVKCLAPLVKKVSEGAVLEMTEKLCDKLLNGKDQHRDTASIAMKTIVSEITSTIVAQRILVSLSPQLVKGITADGMTTEIRCECLDILCDVLHRFGNLMTADHGLLLNSLLSQLSSNQASVRKKAISCIASLASSLSDDLLATATVKVVQLLKNKSQKSEMIRTNIQMVGALSRSVGYRFGPHLGDQITVEDQVQGTQNKDEGQDNSKDLQNNNDKGLEMGDDFEGETCDVTPDSEEDDNDEEEEPDKAMGEVGDSGEVADETLGDMDDEGNQDNKQEKYETGESVKDSDSSTRELRAKEDNAADDTENTNGEESDKQKNGGEDGNDDPEEGGDTEDPVVDKDDLYDEPSGIEPTSEKENQGPEEEDMNLDGPDVSDTMEPDGENDESGEDESGEDGKGNPVDEEDVMD